jgi:hypothetical protein
VITLRAICALALVVALAMGLLHLFNGGEVQAKKTAVRFAPSAARLEANSETYKRGYDF